MKLKDNELAVISAVLFDADIPTAALARDKGLSPAVARATLERLIDRKVLRYYPFINPYSLGYVPYQVYFTPAPSKRQEIISFLNKHTSVSWLIRTSGPYEYCAAVLCRTPFDLKNILCEMGKRLGATFLERVTTIQTELSLFEPKFIFGREASDRSISWQPLDRPPVKLDTIDHRILSGLISNNYLSHRDLARQLSIAPSTFAERINKLSVDGVITRFLYILNLDSLGYKSFKILIPVRTTHPKLREELRELAKQEPHVFTVTECLGPWDFEIDLRCAGRDTVESFVQTLSRYFKKLLGPVQVLEYKERLKLACYPF